MTRRPVRRAGAISQIAAASKPGVVHRKGDPLDERRGAFLDAALPHVDALTNLSRHLTRNRHDADDLMQETFLRAYAHFDQYRGDSFRAWLAAICLNVARSDARRRTRRPIEVLTDETDSDQATAPDQVVADATASLDRAVIRAALDTLPEPQRLCILLMDVAGYTAAETAAVLDCPRGTVLARVHRGRRRLAQVLAGSGVDHA